MIESFDRLVAAMDAAMLVVTVATPSEHDGCLVGFHSQASIEPRRYAVWLSVANRTTRLAEGAELVGVHLLGAEQHDLAALFGGKTGDEVDKFAGIAWHAGLGGVPLITDCHARFVGRVVDRLEVGGDHICVLLDPIEAGGAGPIAPLRLRSASNIDPGHPA